MIVEKITDIGIRLAGETIRRGINGDGVGLGEKLIMVWESYKECWRQFPLLTAADHVLVGATLAVIISMELGKKKDRDECGLSQGQE